MLSIFLYHIDPLPHLYPYSISLCFVVCLVKLCIVFPSNVTTGSTAAATGARETTYPPEGATGPAEVSVRPDPVFTEPTPGAA